MTQLHRQRFQELSEQLARLEASRKPYQEDGARPGRFTVSGYDLLEWKVKVRSLLANVCGRESEHLEQFSANETSMYATNYELLLAMAAVFRAAKEDFEGGYLSSIRSIVQAELFDSELDQARELVAKGFIVPAAVVAGVVLETTLRELCRLQSLPLGKLDGMNAELAKASVYNKLVQKRVTALAAIRNAAAHGQSDQFTAQDTHDMIRDVERLVREHLG